MSVTYDTRNPAVKRLLKEAQELSEPTELYYAQPLEDNLFEWHFTIRGPEDTEFHGGLYHGRILLPSEYPMKPPNIVLLTPNGRFETHRKICLSISGYHPESWRPSWSIRTALLAIIGFMPTQGAGAIGSLDQSKEERQVLARRSQSFTCDHCGPIRDLLRPLTDALRSMTKEVSEAAAQISMSGETSPSKPESDQVTSSEPITSSSETKLTSHESNLSPGKHPVSASSQPSTSVETKEAVNSSPPLPIPGLNPWSGFIPYSPVPTDIISSGQPVYWLCFPVYYPMMPDPNGTVPLNNANLSTASGPSNAVPSDTERSPLSFSEWLKQLKQKTLSENASKNTAQSPPEQSVDAPTSQTNATERQNGAQKEISLNHVSSSNQPVASSSDVQDKTFSEDASKNAAQSLSGSQNDAQKELPLNVSSLSNEPFADTSSARKQHDTVADAQNVCTSLSESENPVATTQSQQVDEPSKSSSPEVPIRYTQSEDGILSHGTEVSGAEADVLSSELRHRTSQEQLEASVVDSFVIGSHHMSGTVTRPESRSMAIVPSSSRAVNICALGVALALFLVVMRRLTLMIHGV